jgi:hypothetical protein
LSLGLAAVVGGCESADVSSVGGGDSDSDSDGDSDGDTDTGGVPIPYPEVASPFQNPRSLATGPISPPPEKVLGQDLDEEDDWDAGEPDEELDEELEEDSGEDE